MNKVEYEEKINDLFERWQKEGYQYHKYNKGDNCFTHDGIANYDTWGNPNPKILFLLKENWDCSWDICDGMTPVGNPNFFNNIARWRHILKEFYKNPDQELSFEKTVLPSKIDDVAIVEVKKLNEGRKISDNNNDIMKYAEKDKEFLKEQIDLINPQIVLCANTGEAYGEWIYYGEDKVIGEWEKLNEDGTRICYRHYNKNFNRLVIYFYHPSYWQYPGGDEGLFNLLCALLKNGEVFNNFDWGKK